MLEILRGMVPTVGLVAILVDPSETSNALGLKNAQAAARKAGVKLKQRLPSIGGHSE